MIVSNEHKVSTDLESSYYWLKEKVSMVSWLYDQDHKIAEDLFLLFLIVIQYCDS